MCGLTGVLGRPGLDPARSETVRKMTATLVHRGPDGAGHVARDGCDLGFRRLSIMDLGAEPGPIEPIVDARVLVALGDSVTTDHISPAGAIAPESPAGRYLQEQGVQPIDFRAKTLARYGTAAGLSRWPAPWRARIAIGVSPQTAVITGPLGWPNGVAHVIGSTSLASTPSKSRRSRPVPPMMPMRSSSGMGAWYTRASRACPSDASARGQRTARP